MASNIGEPVNMAEEFLRKYREGAINAEEFLAQFGKTKIFYSTPFGDHKDGGQRVFLLPAPNNTAYNPVFSSQERLIKFYEKAGRIGYMIMTGTFLSMLETTEQINNTAPIKMGVIIDPTYYDVAISADMLDAVIKLIKQ